MLEPLSLQPPLLDAIGDPHECVHELRVYAKRLRALAQLLRPASGEREVLRALAAQARDAARSLAAARDALVLHRSLQALAARARSPAVRQRLEALAARFPAPAGDAVAPAQLEALLAKLMSVQRQLEPHRCGGDELAAQRGLRRSYRKARRWQQRAQARDCPEACHRWRRWAKYLQYQLVMLGASKDDPEYRQWVQLGRCLGERHDLHNALQALEGLGGKGGGGAVAAARRLLRSRDERLRRQSAELARAAFALSPGEFAQHWAGRLAR